jgi:hypothetical protein
MNEAKLRGVFTDNKLELVVSRSANDLQPATAFVRTRRGHTADGEHATVHDVIDGTRLYVDADDLLGFGLELVRMAEELIELRDE